MSAGGQAHWQDARVVEVEQVADDIVRVVLEPEHPVPGAPGSHIDVVVDIDGAPEVRSYSVVHSAPGGTRLTITVRLSPSSRGGSAFMHRLRAGDPMRMTQPLQNFPMAVGAGRYVFLAGGIGVTALLAMAEAARRRQLDYSFVYVGRSRRAMAYLEDVTAAHGHRLRLHVDDEGTSLDIAEVVAAIAADPRAPVTELYLCGPLPLMDAVRREWVANGLPQVNLRFETFGSGGSYPSEAFTVHVPQQGVTTQVAADMSMLDALEQAGVDVLSDCRKGECGLCSVEVLDHTGTVDHRDVFLSQRQQEQGGVMLCCVSRVAALGRGSAEVTIGVP